MTEPTDPVEALATRLANYYGTGIDESWLEEAREHARALAEPIAQMVEAAGYHRAAALARLAYQEAEDEDAGGTVAARRIHPELRSHG